MTILDDIGHLKRIHQQLVLTFEMKYVLKTSKQYPHISSHYLHSNVSLHGYSTHDTWSISQCSFLVYAIQINPNTRTNDTDIRAVHTGKCSSCMSKCMISTYMHMIWKITNAFIHMLLRLKLLLRVDLSCCNLIYARHYFVGIAIFRYIIFRSNWIYLTFTISRYLTSITSSLNYIITVTS